MIASCSTSSTACRKTNGNKSPWTFPGTHTLCHSSQTPTGARTWYYSTTICRLFIRCVTPHRCPPAAPRVPPFSKTCHSSNRLNLFQRRHSQFFGTNRFSRNPHTTFDRSTSGPGSPFPRYKKGQNLSSPPLPYFPGHSRLCSHLPPCTLSPKKSCWNQNAPF